MIYHEETPTKRYVCPCVSVCQHSAASGPSGKGMARTITSIVVLALIWACPTLGMFQVSEGRQGNRTLVILGQQSMVTSHSRFLDLLRGLCPMFRWFSDLACRYVVMFAYMHAITRCWGVLSAAGHSVDVHMAEGSSVALKRFGEWQYDNLVLMAPRHEGT